MSKILKNTTASPIVINDVGYVSIPASPGSYTIPPMDYLLWAQSSDIIVPVGDGDIVVNDGNKDLTPSDGINLIRGACPPCGSDDGAKHIVREKMIIRDGALVRLMSPAIVKITDGNTGKYLDIKSGSEVEYK